MNEAKTDEELSQQKKKKIFAWSFCEHWFQIFDLSKMSDNKVVRIRTIMAIKTAAIKIEYRPLHRAK